MPLFASQKNLDRNDLKKLETKGIMPLMAGRVAEVLILTAPTSGVEWRQRQRS
jgi:hypothetical protein